MLITTITVLDVFNKSKYSIQLKSLQEDFPNTKIGEIKKQEFYDLFPQTSNYIEFKEKISEELGIVGQKIILKDGRIFFRDIYVRADDSGHKNTELHINIYFFSRDHQTGKKKKHNLKNCHFIKVGTAGSKPIHILLSSQGKAIRRTILILSSKQDQKYHKEEHQFLKKIKEGKISKIDQRTFNKNFNSYVKYLQKEKVIQ
jgi:hypothetical protein